MRAGDKENLEMTVTLAKRLFSSTAEGDGQQTQLGSPSPASKRLRLLPPFSEHLPSTHNLKPGSSTAAGSGPVQQTQSSTARKRRHDTEPGNGSAAAASPAGSGKRGKRDNGRPSNAAPSPNSAKTALEALLTCEGLERDADLQAEVAYLNARVQGAAAAAAAAARPSAASTADAGDAADVSSSGADATASAAADEPQAGAAAAAAGRSGASGSSSAVLDAARSSREKRRDQDQNPRARRASGSARNIRDQLAIPASPDAPQEAAAAAAADAEEQPDSPRPVSLELIGDKEWQRLFAVLTLSDTAAGRASGAGGSEAGQDQPGTAAAAGAAGAAYSRSVGIRSHRLSRALHVSELPTAAAAAAVVQEAPSTPARREGGGGSAGCDVTPSRRSSFLAGEWQRVHQQRLSTPQAPQPPAAAAGRDAVTPFGADCDMDC